MTTGRINQVTTFRSAFTGVIYSRASIARFRNSEFIHPTVKDPFVAQGRLVQAHLNSQMVSPHFSFSHVSGEITLSSGQESPTFREDYQ